MKLIRIGIIDFAIEELPNDYWKLFETEGTDKPVIELRVDHLYNLAGGMKKVQLEQEEFLLVNGEEFLLVNKHWSKGRLIHQGDMEKADFLIFQMYYANVVKRQSIFFHSSLVRAKDLGLMFLGPSGIGKTTQADLWEKHRGSRTVNGDRALLGRKDGRWTAQGWPVCGTSEVCHNEDTPIRAVVMLSQAKENHAERMTPGKAFPR